MNTINYRANFLLALFCMLVLPFFADGQARDKKETVGLLCHGWVADTAKNKGKMDCFPPDAGSFIRFLTSGYVVFDEKKGAEGVWNYDAARNNLYLIINGTLWKYKLNSITATEMVVENTLGKNTTAWNLRRVSE